MSGTERWTQPATDVPIEHTFDGFVNTVCFRNRSAVAGAYVDIEFPSGGVIRVYAGETFILDAEDTSRETAGGKFWAQRYTVAGDNANAQVIEAIWTTKAPIGLQHEPTV